jgi:hypothetical protein
MKQQGAIAGTGGLGNLRRYRADGAVQLAIGYLADIVVAIGDKTEYQPIGAIRRPSRNKIDPGSELIAEVKIVDARHRRGG